MSRQKMAPEHKLTEFVTVRLTPSDFDSLCRVARMRREEKLQKMLREWVLERLGAELSGLAGFRDLKTERVM